MTAKINLTTTQLAQAYEALARSLVKDGANAISLSQLLELAAGLRSI